MSVGSTKSQNGFYAGVVQKMASQVNGADLPMRVVEEILEEVVSERAKWREIVNLRFSEPARSLAVVAEIVGVSRERVYQIETECLQRLSSCVVRARVTMKDEDAVLDISIKDFGLGTRAVNGLRSMGVASVRDVLKFSRADLYKTWNLGVKSVLEIEEAMARFGLALRADAVTPRRWENSQPQAEALVDEAPSRPRG